jgi:hypothetical protein
MPIGVSKTVPGPRDPADEKMEQIRDLLFGEYQRQSELRINQLEARIRDLEAALGHRLDALQARFDGHVGETEAGRRTAFDELSRGVQDLAERIRQIPRD